MLKMWKMKILFLLCLVIGIPLAAAAEIPPTFQFPKPAPYNYKSPSLSEEQISIGDLHLFDTPEHVEKLLGQPEESIENELQNGYQRDLYNLWDYNSKHLHIAFVNGKAATILITEGSELKTPDGLGIGMTKADMMRIYGSVPFQKDSVSDDIVCYMYRSDNGDIVKLLKIHCTNDIVSKISISHW